jgi:hypothetical protein
MAGRRQGTGKPTRARARMARHKSRVQGAPTGEAQLAAAFDMLRSVAYRHPQRGSVLHAEASALYQRALELDGAAA